MNINPAPAGPSASFSQALDPIQRPPAGDGGSGTQPVSNAESAKAVQANGQTQRNQQDAPQRNETPPAPRQDGAPRRDIPRGSFVDIRA